MQLEGNQWKSLRPQLVTLLFVLFVFTVPLWTPIACRLRASASVAPRNFTNLKHSPRQLPPPRAKCRYRMAAQNPRCFGRKKTEGNAKQPQSNGFVLRRALSLSQPRFLHEACWKHMVRWAKEHFRVGFATVRWTRLLVRISRDWKKEEMLCTQISWIQGLFQSGCRYIYS